MKTAVVAALLERDGKFLICQRPRQKARGLLWEFVGGKVEKGESKEDALRRECEEELGIRIDVGEAFCEVTHEYPDITIELTLFTATTTEEPKKIEHNDLRWITVKEIPQYDFCPADKEILRRLQEREG